MSPVEGGGCWARRTIAALVAPTIVLAGCENLQTYLLEGRLWDEDAACLSKSGVIDVVEGVPSTGCTGVRCLESLETGDVFVTTACDVPPAYLDRSTEDAGACADALAAYELGDAGSCP